MKEKTARILALALLAAAFALNVAGYIILPAELTISLFGDKPLPKLILLAVAFALSVLVAYRLSTEKNEPVRTQWVVIMCVIIALNAVLVFFGAGAAV